MATAGENRTRAMIAALAPLFVGLAHFAAATGSLMLTRWSNGLASIWLPNAILLAYLLVTPRRRWLAACAIVALSGTAANGLGGAPWPLAFLYGLTNAMEPLGTALIMGGGRKRIDFERIGDLLRFASGAFAMAILSASLAAGVSSAAYDAGLREAWISWFSSAFLGLTIVTPLLLIAHKQLRSPLLTLGQLIEGFAVLGLVAATGTFVFAQTHYPLFFLLQPPVLIATFRLRAAGAAASVLLLAAIGTAAVMLGVGPTAIVGGSFGEQISMLQVLLAATILTALPVAALLSQRDRFALGLTQKERQLASVLDAVSDVIFRTDMEGRWTYLNPAWEKLTGQPIEESIGKCILDHVDDEDRASFLDRMRSLDSGLVDTVRHQFRFRTATGEQRWGESQSSRIEDENGKMIGTAGIIVDISDRLALAALADDARRKAERKAQAALALAATDELTGLASRRAFLAMLDRALSDRRGVAVALFDVDHFKRVNDRHGHAAGDEVLRRIARIADDMVRDGDLVGRLGGEEFAILMMGTSLEHAAAVGERLRKACAAATHGHDMTVTVSVGVAEAREGITSSMLLREADEALYRAKFEGRNCLRMAA